MRLIAPQFVLSVAATLATPALAAAAPILDYRAPAKPAPTYPKSVQATLATALASADPRLAGELGPDFVILGRASGSFTASGLRQEVFLVAKSAPIAAEPFPQGGGQHLVVLGRDNRATVGRLPADQRYQAIAGAIDTDGDGRSELLLEAESYNMGQAVTSLSVLEFTPTGSVRVRQQLDEVAFDGCENPVGRREKRASTVVIAQGALKAESHKLKCR